MKITRVWACCGIYGWLIPWPEWHTRGVYAQPPDDKTSEYVYLFSRKGQTDPSAVGDLALLAEIANLVKIIDLDDFLNRDGVPDWWSVLTWIVAPPCECGNKACKMATKFLGSCGNCGKPVHASCSTHTDPDGNCLCSSMCWFATRGLPHPEPGPGVKCGVWP